MNKQPRLEVVIATFGEEGMARVAAHRHPQVEGVIYTVCWQTGGCAGEVPDEIASRDDFRVFKFDSRGLSVNRNHGLDVSIGELILISDDDLNYTPEGLAGIISAFDERPNCGFLTFRYTSAPSDTSDTSATSGKYYADAEFDWSSPVKGAYVASCELAFRRDKVVGKQRFNTYFGVGGVFGMGEEDLFVEEMRRRGLTGHFVPFTICDHPGLTTSGRAGIMELAEVKGAVFLYLHPHTWFLRMLSHARRTSHPWEYCRRWLAGGKKAKRMKVFG